MTSATPSTAAAYDSIAETYNVVRSRKNPKDLFEYLNVKSVMQPLLQSGGDSKSCLELACGSGYYSFPLLSWGASSVTAVDISANLLDIGRQIAGQMSLGADKIRFLLSDCSQLVMYENAASGTGKGDFDVALAAWLLPYAADAVQLTTMITNVGSNLKSNGTFVAVTTPASNDPRADFDQETTARPLSAGGLWREILADVPDGISMRVHLPPKAGAVAKDDNYFDAYRLRKEVYEQAARDAGMSAVIQWIRPSIAACGPEAEGLKQEDAYAAVPEFNLLILRKS